jgi:hypothetical protein
MRFDCDRQEGGPPCEIRPRHHDTEKMINMRRELLTPLEDRREMALPALGVFVPFLVSAEAVVPFSGVSKFRPGKIILS